MPKCVKSKAKCCKDDPRCKKCPVVLKRLADAGYAERDGRRFTFVEDVPKKQLKAARARKAPA
jgi:hypothetical protein